MSTEPTTTTLAPATVDRFGRLALTFGATGFLFPLAFAGIAMGIKALRGRGCSSNPEAVKRRAVAGITLAAVWLALMGGGLFLSAIGPKSPAAQTAALPLYPADSEHVAAMIRELVEGHGPMIAEFNQGLVNTRGMTHKAGIVSIEAEGERAYRAKVSLVSRQDSGWGVYFDLTVRASFNAGEEKRRSLNVARSGPESWWLLSTYTDKVEIFKGAAIGGEKNDRGQHR